MSFIVADASTVLMTKLVPDNVDDFSLDLMHSHDKKSVILKWSIVNGNDKRPFIQMQSNDGGKFYQRSLDIAVKICRFSSFLKKHTSV